MAATELAASPARTLRRDRGVARVRDIPSNHRSDQPTTLLIGRNDGDGLNLDVTESAVKRQEVSAKSALSGINVLALPAIVRRKPAVRRRCAGGPPTTVGDRCGILRE